MKDFDLDAKYALFLNNCIVLRYLFLLPFHGALIYREDTGNEFTKNLDWLSCFALFNLHFKRWCINNQCDAFAFSFLVPIF